MSLSLFFHSSAGQFGSLHWSKDETKLLYVAERKPPKMVSFFDTKAGEKTDGEPPVRVNIQAVVRSTRTVKIL